MIVLGLLLAAHICVSASLIGGSSTARRSALMLGMATVPLAWLAPANARGARALFALGALWVLARLVDIVATPCNEAYSWRVWYLTAPFDARHARRREFTLEPAQIVSLLGYGAAFALGVVLVCHVAPRFEGAVHMATRWSGALLAVYAAAETGAAALTIAHALVGIEIPPIQRTPIRARTIAEFWSQRWNRPVSCWLRAHCFAPLARRGWPSAGLALAFLASAFLHSCFIGAALGASMAAMMGLFFVVQIPLLMAERALRVRSWPTVAARIWTVTALAFASPLFTEPLLRVFSKSG